MLHVYIVVSHCITHIALYFYLFKGLNMMETISNRLVITLTSKNVVIITVCIGFGVLLLSALHSSHSSSFSATSGTYNLQTQSMPSKSLFHHPHIPKHSNIDKGEQRFPQAIIIGVKKGGTRALIDMLKSHPQIVSPKGEIHFFDRDEMFRKGISWYIGRMPYSTTDQITIEKSPSYFITPDVPKRIFHLAPSVKLLLIVRNPIERAISDYSQLFSPGRRSRNLTFDDFVIHNHHVDDNVSVIKVSTYAIHMVRWLRYFPLQQIHVVNGDALILDPAPEIIRVQEFLGVSSFFQNNMFYFNYTKGFYCWNKVMENGYMHQNCLGSGKGRPHPDISKTTQELLKQYFASHNERFFELVEKRFDWNN